MSAEEKKREREKEKGSVYRFATLSNLPPSAQWYRVWCARLYASTVSGCIPRRGAGTNAMRGLRRRSRGVGPGALNPLLDILIRLSRVFQVARHARLLKKETSRRDYRNAPRTRLGSPERGPTRSLKEKKKLRRPERRKTPRRIGSHRPS